MSKVNKLWMEFKIGINVENEAQVSGPSSRMVHSSGGTTAD